MPTPPELGYVVIWSDDPAMQVLARLGPERPNVSAGYGGWEEVARPRRSTVTTWAGQPARRMSVSILLDEFAAGTSVETDIRRLERMALPRPGGQPPNVWVDAKGAHLPYQGRTWVVDGIEWGDASMNRNGNRTRQAATLTLLEFVSDQLIQARLRKSPAQRRREKKSAESGRGSKKNAREKRKPAGPTRKKTNRARSAAPAYDGEGLAAVAARELGDARRWREIADLNGIRDPRAVKAGQVLRLP